MGVGPSEPPAPARVPLSLYFQGCDSAVGWRWGAGQGSAVEHPAIAQIGRASVLELIEQERQPVSQGLIGMPALLQDLQVLSVLGPIQEISQGLLLHFEQFEFEQHLGRVTHMAQWFPDKAIEPAP